MTAKERLNTILYRIENHGQVEVKALAVEFRVTEDLIRKDLKKLEKMDLIDRVHGGAERKTKKFETSGILYRLSVNEKGKVAIAEKAYELLRSGDHVFLDTSSTSGHIAHVIQNGPKELTVITDMLYVMTCLSGAPHVRLIAIGGNYTPYSGGFSGLDSAAQIKRFKVDVAFVSCRSVDLDQGALYEGFSDIGETKRLILNTASTKVVATQYSKLSNKGVYHFYDLSDIDWLITDEALSDSQMQVLSQWQVQFKIN